MRRKDAKYILQKYLDGQCTPSEAKLVESWLDHEASSGIGKAENTEKMLRSRDNIREQLIQTIRAKQPNTRQMWTRLSIAACFLAFVVFGAVLLRNEKEEGEYLVVNKVVEEVVTPGSQSAILTLSDGSTIRLDDIGEGVLEHNDGVKISQSADGQLAYEVDNSQSVQKTRINKISIPFGGFYKVILQDGTKVSLNSGSTLVYPTQFTGDTRSVELQGEAYFEVASNKKRPFIVKARDTDIRVTGTSFNLEAYTEEKAIVTTLLEGEVYVSKEQATVRLQPGEQSTSVFGTSRITKKAVDAKSSIAWTTGYFIFEDQEIESILREVARWYDVDIYVQRKSADKKLGGIFSRQKSVEELLHYLKKLNVLEFEKEGRRVTVML
ncbi:DUF4974 domain-containing protein [Parapedobacter sp. SGR-10]|uniref:FecR domain-containing protein n=1 Tax=Parapedobacter sp. SGR-10 TaxID=2710879 RepID=UPI0013CF9611|nr:FecR domain-containing protein [Parapedobacter sp. SGR-10]NGF56594.1 DUF4974 domain-containing protein [Parapedobacter sp. SGR-10]